MSATAGLTAANVAGPAALGIASIGDAYSNSQARKAQAAYAEGIYNVDSRFAEVQAEDSIARGEFHADEVLRQSSKNLSIIRANVKKVSAEQRTGFAAQGIESTSGSAADVLADTQFLGSMDESDVKRNAALDVISIKNNAWREAWGFKAQAEVYRGQGRFASMAGATGARNTLLTGGLKALGYATDAGYQGFKSFSGTGRSSTYNSNKPNGEYT